MKKYIIILLAFMAVFTSCTNDAVTIKYATNFKINPSTVIAPFTWEWNPGDLETFDTNYQLRIRLLIYNSDGLLETEDVQYFSNYSVMMNSSVQLSDGAYTAVAITDLVGKSSGAVEEYWILSDYNKLADTHIDDAGYIGGKNKILGISSERFTVSGAVKNDIALNVKPAGSLFFVWFRNIHTFSDVNRLSLVTSKSTEKCIFDANGDFSIASESAGGEYNWYIDYVDVSDYQDASGIYNYLYVLPTTNMNLKFMYETETGEGDLSSVMTVGPKAGDQYMFELNLCDGDYDNGITYYYGLMNGSRGTGFRLLKNTESEGKDLLIEHSQKNYLRNIK